MDEFISAILSQRGRVFILDVGRSYEKTVRLLGGEIIQFTRKAPLCINPFSAIHAEDPEEVEDSLTMLKSVLALMASPLGGVTDDEMTFIEKALQQAWLERYHIDRGFCLVDHESPHCSSGRRKASSKGSMGDSLKEKPPSISRTLFFSLSLKN